MSVWIISVDSFDSSRVAVAVVEVAVAAVLATLPLIALYSYTAHKQIYQLKIL